MIGSGVAAAANPIKRKITTDEMARAVLFLASDDATSLAGMDLDVTGAPGWPGERGPRERRKG